MCEQNEKHRGEYEVKERKGKLGKSDRGIKWKKTIKKKS